MGLSTVANMFKIVGTMPRFHLASRDVQVHKTRAAVGVDDRGGEALRGSCHIARSEGSTAEARLLLRDMGAAGAAFNSGVREGAVFETIHVTRMFSNSQLQVSIKNSA